MIDWLINILQSLFLALVNYVYPRRALRKRFARMLREAKDYGDWVNAAEQFDRLEGNDVWKEEKRTFMYDAELVEARTEGLRSARATGDVHKLVFLLRGGLDRALGGLDNPRLFQRCFFGTKRIITDYTDEVVKQLHYVVETEQLTHAEKMKFFKETRQAFGGSALLLSGGAGLGLLHFGVIKCLHEWNLLPRVVSGSSIGALAACFLGTHTDEELSQLFASQGINVKAFDGLQSGSIQRKVARMLKHGVLMDVRKLEDFCRDNFGDVTFLEAYERTGRVINVTVGSVKNREMPRLLNYLTAPNVLIATACSASCASPVLYEPTEISAKDHLGRVVRWAPSVHKWTDGSPHCDLPMARLAELFNVNHFIVSQVNPHVVPFIPATKKTGKRYRGLIDGAKRLFLDEVYHRVLQFVEVGFLPRSFQSLISQNYRGDVTVVPDLGLFETLKLFLTNPSEELVRKCTVIGERSTWPYVAIIRSRCKIELTLDRCFATVRNSVPPTLSLDDV